MEEINYKSMWISLSLSLSLSLSQLYVGEHKYVHVKIFKALPCYGGGMTVTGVQFPKLVSDPLVPF